MSISGQQKHGLGMIQQTACLTQITPKAISNPGLLCWITPSLSQKKNEVWKKFAAATFFYKQQCTETGQWQVQ